jgi:hypothetical protein
MSWEADWPAFARSKNASFQCRLAECERQQCPVLVRDEWALRSLQEHLRQHYEIACTVIERVRGSTNLSQSKIKNFRRQLGSTVEFFNSGVPFIALTTSFTSTVAPLTVRFSYRFVNERKAFFREQNNNVAVRAPKFIQIRNDMQEMSERRQRLKAGDHSLARMFGLLEKFRPSLGMEEEDDEEFDYEGQMEYLTEAQK